MPRPPDPAALRRDRKDDAAWLTLPHRDPDAAVPDFPLDAPTPRELHWWERHWRMPQATQWELRGEEVTVALFVRVLAQAEKPGAPVTIHRPLRQLRDELGLSIDGLRRRRWFVPADPAASNARPATVTPIHGSADRRSAAKDEFAQVNTGRTRSSAKDRFHVTYTPPAADDPAPF